jgi:hypothetical protein
MTDRSLAAHNRGYGDDVVWVGRVAHAEKKTKSNDRKERNHFIQTAAAALERVCRRSRNSRYSSIPSSVFTDNLNTSTPGRAAWMSRITAASSNSTAAARLPAFAEIHSRLSAVVCDDFGNL